MTAEAGSLTKQLRTRLLEDPARSAATEVRMQSAARIAGSLPMVHRTGGASSTINASFLADTLHGDAQTPVEKRHGHPQAVYFFFGAAAYPRGLVALIFRSENILSKLGTFTPFDTGGACKEKMIWKQGAKAGLPVTTAEGEQLYLDHHSEVGELLGVAALWIAAHFDDPIDYVRRPLVSAPDRPTLHGFESATGHRLAWTLEVQCHQPVPVTEVEDILVGRRALARQDIPREWKRKIRYLPEPEECGEEDFDRWVAQLLLNRLQS